MQNIRKYNLLYFVVLHCVYPTILAASRFSVRMNEQKCQTTEVNFAHIFMVPIAGEAFQYFKSNLWHWINFPALGVRCVCVCVCVLVGLCLSVFALRSATIFHIFQHFFLRSFGLALMSGLDTANMNRGIEPKPPEPSFCFRSFFSQFSLPSDVLRRSTSKCQIENWWIPLIEFDRCQALSAAINLRQMYDVQRPSLGLKEDPECLGNYYKVDAGQKPCIPKIFRQNNLNTLRHRTKGVH